jgi:hypothetical protein
MPQVGSFLLFTIDTGKLVAAGSILVCAVVSTTSCVGASALLQLAKTIVTTINWVNLCFIPVNMAYYFILLQYLVFQIVLQN